MQALRNCPGLESSESSDPEADLIIEGFGDEQPEYDAATCGELRGDQHLVPRWFESVCCLLSDGLYALFTALQACASKDGRLPPYEHRSTAVASDAGAQDSNPPHRWLGQCVKLVHPSNGASLGKEHSAKLLAVLLAAPKAANKLQAVQMLEILWRDLHACGKSNDSLCESIAHALVAAVDLPPTTADEDSEDDEDDDEDESTREARASLRPASHVGSMVAYLHDYLVKGKRKHKAGQRDKSALLVSIIMRCLRWAYSQSEAALASSRGAWLDASLTHLLDLCSPSDASRVQAQIEELVEALRSQHGKVKQPTCPRFDEILKGLCRTRTSRESVANPGMRSTGDSASGSLSHFRSQPQRGRSQRGATERGRSTNASHPEDDLDDFGERSQEVRGHRMARHHHSLLTRAPSMMLTRTYARFPPACRQRRFR